MTPLLKYYITLWWCRPVCSSSPQPAATTFALPSVFIYSSMVVQECLFFIPPTSSDDLCPHLCIYLFFYGGAGLSVLHPPGHLVECGGWAHEAPGQGQAGHPRRGRRGQDQPPAGRFQPTPPQQVQQVSGCMVILWQCHFKSIYRMYFRFRTKDVL